MVQPVVDVSPPKWHLGHTTWFFENFVLVPNKPDYKVFDADFNFLFNSYYESVGQRVARPNRGFLSRPTVEKVFDYRAYVNQHMEAFLEGHELSATLESVIELGLQHEQQHQELLVTDTKFIFGQNPLLPAYLPASKAPAKASTLQETAWLSVPEGVYEFGHTGGGFSFDNERGPQKAYLHAFSFSNKLVTNAEYMAFMEAGGYTDFRHWLSEGWDWVNTHQVNSPMYWEQKEGQWHQFTMHGLLPVDPDAPVTHVSYFEADAFAAWSGKRLLTEFEWERACQLYAPEVPAAANFVEDEYYHTTAAQAGNMQLLGDAWEWTASAYLPYAGFEKEAGAIGEYNGKFMVNQMVLRGGSCATPRDHIRNTYRNFWHAHLRWQFNGIRLAQTSK